MSLVNALMNGTYGSTSVDASKYGHATGAMRIATESTEELYDIFLEFYDVEQAELASIHEGVDLYDSQYAYVAEAAIGNAFAKIKEFFKKLWDKVKAFFHAIKRYIDSIFMSGKDFVKKYMNDIKAADNDLTDFSYKMYKYDDAAINSLTSTDALFTSDELIDDCVKDLGSIGGMLKKQFLDRDDFTGNESGQIAAKGPGGKTVAVGSMDKYDAMVDATKKWADRDTIIKDFARGLGLSMTDPEDLPKACFSFFRNGAEDANDKEDIDIKSLASYAKVLDTNIAQNVDRVSKKTDTAYKKAIDVINAKEREVSKLKSEDPQVGSKYSSKIAEMLRNMSSGISVLQGCTNAVMDAWKKVISERDGVYKSMILAGISNAKKAKRKK